MLDFEDLEAVKAELRKSQDAEEDQREAAREAKLFLVKRNGQWDQYAWSKMDGRYRGTFDMCTPVVDQIAGEIDQSDFSLVVSPTGGEASDQDAKVLNGLVRNIRNISNADDVFNSSARNNVVSGFDCFEITQDYIDADSFDQDLFIKKIPSAIDSVWFDCGATERDKSDALFAFKLTGMTKQEYQSKYPDGSMQSIGTDRSFDAYSDKPELITVGQFYYKKPENIELVKMSDGSVYRDDDKFQSIKDELAQAGITETDRRTRKGWRVHSRIFDGQKWLTKPQKTVFNNIPLCPIYGNYDVVENKPVYFGVIEKLYDHQRTLNYAVSRDVEDGALSPSATTWMTADMAAGYEGDYQDMNTAKKPIRLFNIDPKNPNLVPQQAGGAQPSMALQTTISNMQQMFQTSSNVFTAQQGNANPNQSGIAGLQQIEAGNTGSIKWFKALQTAVCYAGKVLLDAIPRVYDSTRQVRILEDDGTAQTVTLNSVVFDNQTGKPVELYDLSKGDYDVVCEFGAAFNTQQKESVETFLQVAQVDPTIIEQGKDIFLKSIGSPAMTQMAERVRQAMLNSGMIPQSQMTEEELQQAAIAQQQAAQQPQEPTPEMILAQAEMLKGQAEQLKAQNDQTQLQIDAAKLQTEQQKIAMQSQGQADKLQSETAVNIAKVQQGDRQLDLKEQELQFKQVVEMQKQQAEQQQQFMNNIMAQNKAIVDNLNTQANTLNVLRSAMGVDAVVSDETVEAYSQQAEIVTEEQEKQEGQ